MLSLQQIQITTDSLINWMNQSKLSQWWEDKSKNLQDILKHAEKWSHCLHPKVKLRLVNFLENIGLDREEVVKRFLSDIDLVCSVSSLSVRMDSLSVHCMTLP